MYLALLLSLPSALALQATITAPAILPRQEVANSATPEFIGFTYESAKWAKWDCRSGSAFLTSGSFGRCAATASESFIPTGCTRGSVMVGESSSSTCTGTAAQTSCVSGTVYHFIGDRLPINNYQCWPAWNGGSWDATIATTIPPSTLSSSTVASQTSSPSPTSSVASETAPSQQTTTPPEPPQTEEKKSQAWIAGPVIGGIAAVALLGAGFWFWRRKQAKKPYQNMPHEMGAESKGASVYAYNSSPNGGPNAHGTWNAAAGGPGSSYAPAELQGHTLNELDGSAKLQAVEADGRAVGKH